MAPHQKDMIAMADRTNRPAHGILTTTSVQTAGYRQEDADTKSPQLWLLIRSLDHGGAQRQVIALACGLHARGWPVSVACFYVGGAYTQILRNAGVPVLDLGKHGRWDVFGVLFRLWKLLRRKRPDIVYSFLPTANLLALAMRCAFPSMRVAWGVRSTNVDLSCYDWLEKITYWLECRTAHFADLVIANSEAGARLRIAQGFPAQNMRVIPNGIDTERFCFDRSGRQRVRDEWGVADHEVLVGLVARLDPMKDHPTLLRAAALLAQRDPRWRFVCVGAGPADYTLAMHELCKHLGLSERVIWARARDDMAATYSALDIATSSSSFGEGFPNAVAEAMACERFCVVTDVGDSARIVADLGVVVPPGQPSALADGIEHVLRQSREVSQSVGTALRQRIADRYSVEFLTTNTACVLQTLHGTTKRSAKVTL